VKRPYISSQYISYSPILEITDLLPSTLIIRRDR